jgi:hypothetical protein
VVCKHVSEPGQCPPRRPLRPPPRWRANDGVDSVTSPCKCSTSLRSLPVLSSLRRLRRRELYRRPHDGFGEHRLVGGGGRRREGPRIRHRVLGFGSLFLLLPGPPRFRLPDYNPSLGLLRRPEPVPPHCLPFPIDLPAPESPLASAEWRHASRHRSPYDDGSLRFHRDNRLRVVREPVCT